MGSKRHLASFLRLMRRYVGETDFLRCTNICRKKYGQSEKLDGFFRR